MHWPQPSCSNVQLKYFQLLLALLGALVQDKYREQFVQPAFMMDERSQMELKAMIESVLFMNDMDTNLPAGFDDVLKRNIGRICFILHCPLFC